MKRILLALLSCAAIQASTITFTPGTVTSSTGTTGAGNTTTNGNSATWTSSEGWTVTARTFSVNTAGTSEFLAAALQIFDVLNTQALGLGSCNQSASEAVGGGGNCGSTTGASVTDQWQFDNGNPAGSDARDFLLLTFSQPVSVQGLVLLQSSVNAHDTDLDYYFNTTAGTITANVTTLATLGGAGFGSVNTDDGGTLQDLTPGCPCPTRSVTLAANSGVRSLLIAARSGQTDDFFKVSSLTASAVPEPSSMALVGLGLVGLGYVARRKRKL